VDYKVGELVEMKKPHPCGANRWEILRVGMDFRIRCQGCGRLVLLPRRDFEKGVRKVLKD